MLLGDLFRNTIARFIRWAMNSDSNVSSSNHTIGAQSKVRISTDASLPVTFNFTITNASGGKVVVVRHYDARHDRTIENVYIITDNDNLGEELEQIITKESLSK